MDDTNRSADHISELKKLPNWKSTHHTAKSRGKPGRMGEQSKAPDSRKSSVENSGTRVCAWVRMPLLSENVFNTTRQSLQLTNSIILERQFKMTVQSKRKQTTRNVIGWLIAVWFKMQKKERRYPAKTCETRKYTWASTKFFSNGWHKPLRRSHLWIEKITQLKKHTSYSKKSR